MVHSKRRLLVVTLCSANGNTREMAVLCEVWNLETREFFPFFKLLTINLDTPCLPRHSTDALCDLLWCINNLFVYATQNKTLEFYPDQRAW